jgi:hypothetical protein
LRRTSFHSGFDAAHGTFPVREGSNGIVQYPYPQSRHDAKAGRAFQGNAPERYVLCDATKNT